MTSNIHMHNKNQLNDNVYFSLIETFLKNNDRPSKLDKTYIWVGKCRKNANDNGGI